MDLQFSYNYSDERTLNKKISGGTTLHGVLKDDSSLIHPVILIESSEVVNYNFCYISQWKRYYFVRNIVSYRNNMYLVYLECDVLMSFRNDISKLKVIVDKQTMFSNADEYIDDGSLVVDNYMFTKIYKYTKGFNDEPEYILITAG